MKHTLSGSTEELSLTLSKISKILAFKGYINYLEDKVEKGWRLPSNRKR